MRYNHLEIDANHDPSFRRALELFVKYRQRHYDIQSSGDVIKIAFAKKPLKTVQPGLLERFVGGCEEVCRFSFSLDDDISVVLPAILLLQDAVQHQRACFFA